MRTDTKISKFTTDERRSFIKEKIEAAESRYMTIIFRKVDGTPRSMTIQQAAMAPLIKGDAASETAKKAVATRKKNNPHLVPVYDVTKKQIRSVNLDTTFYLETNGSGFEFIGSPTA